MTNAETTIARKTTAGKDNEVNKTTTAELAENKAEQPPSVDLKIGSDNKQAVIDSKTHYCLAPGVAIRPERFGGLVYRYDNRRLYFLHSHELVEFVTGLDGRSPLDEALGAFFTKSSLAQSAGTQFVKALQQLSNLGALIEKKPASTVRRIL